MAGTGSGNDGAGFDTSEEGVAACCWASGEGCCGGVGLAPLSARARFRSRPAPLSTSLSPAGPTPRQGSTP